MFRLVVGLGNPGAQYERTRHNAGFWFLDGLASSEQVTWSRESRFYGMLTNFLFQGHKVWLFKPEMFMNKSGHALLKLVNYYNIAPSEILVAHDELDFDAGVVRLKKSGGHGGHNGLRDIIAQLGAKDFCRLRIGVGRPVQQMNAADYVLSAPSRADRAQIEQALEKVYEKKDLMLAGQLDSLMNHLH